jgi:phycocyanin-associated, rod
MMSDNNAIDRETYSDRKVVIQAIGSFNQKRKGKYTVIVPYSRLSQTIQQISRTGGRIVNISINSSSLINPEVVEKPTEPSQINTSKPDLIPETPKITESEKIENQPLKSSKKVETEVNQKETITSAAPLPITSSKIEKRPNKPRRKKLQFERITNFKKTTKNPAKTQGKKSRKRSKLYLN